MALNYFNKLAILHSIFT